jgi:PIN domain nuclease of toxin-antitoxin system
MITNDILLDTCAAIWISEDAQLSQTAVDALDNAFDRGKDIYVSPFTAWEIGMLVSRGRISSVVSPEIWFQNLMAQPMTKSAPLLPEILIASSYLPGIPPRDPADRIMIATARHYNFTLMTRDNKIADYAEDGHVRVLMC